MQAFGTFSRDLLAPYLRAGRVDYAALDRGVDFEALTAAIAAYDPAPVLPEQRLAFYLNAYNLLVLHSVLQRLRRSQAWPGCVSFGDKLRFFVLARHRVGGQRMSLYQLENRIIRRQFGEPRIHFALNCASRSCPPLASQLFHGESLDADLERLTAAFLHSDAVRPDAASGTLHLNRIFRWYARDFAPSPVAFIRHYRELPDAARVSYQPYDWRLNGWAETSGDE